MKKLLLSLLFITTTFITQAQDGKPTKEETVKFLNTLVQSGIGNTLSEYAKITSCELTYDYFEFKETYPSGNEYTYTWKNIPWAEIDKMDAYEDKGGSYMCLEFKYSFACIKLDKQSTANSFCPWIPKNKIESAKKAFLRLAEITKEENKNPFAN